MSKHDFASLVTRKPEAVAEHSPEVSRPLDYQRPQLFVIGAAVDLLQSYGTGAYQDAYTRYYWNR